MSLSNGLIEYEVRLVPGLPENDVYVVKDPERYRLLIASSFELTFEQTVEAIAKWFDARAAAKIRHDVKLWLPELNGRLVDEFRD